MKARKVKGLDPAGPLAENAAKIVRVRLDELLRFMPRAGEREDVQALHDMRIAAKRLRYVLEVTGPCFGPYVQDAVARTRELQDLLGEIHDCDVQLPDVRRRLARVVVADARALTEAAGPAPDLDPALYGQAPGRTLYPGLVALTAYVRARRDLLFERFLGFWAELEREGFAARLDTALTERPG